MSVSKTVYHGHEAAVDSHVLRKYIEIDLGELEGRPMELLWSLTYAYGEKGHTPEHTFFTFEATDGQSIEECTKCRVKICKRF